MSIHVELTTSSTKSSDPNTFWGSPTWTGWLLYHESTPEPTRAIVIHYIPTALHAQQLKSSAHNIGWFGAINNNYRPLTTMFIHHRWLTPRHWCRGTLHLQTYNHEDTSVTSQYDVCTPASNGCYWYKGRVIHWHNGNHQYWRHRHSYTAITLSSHVLHRRLGLWATEGLEKYALNYEDDNIFWLFHS